MRFYQTILFTGLIWLVAACNSQPVEPVSPAASPTEVAKQVVTNPDQATSEAPEVAPTVTLTTSPIPTPSSTPVPTVTPEKTATPISATATNEPELISVDKDSGTNVNVRSGPGTNYPVVTQLEPGDSARVTGQNDDASWWEIKLPNGGAEAGWVYGAIVTFSGEPENVAVAEIPPPPATATPAPESAPPDNETTEESPAVESEAEEEAPPASAEDLADQLNCGKDFCVTFQAMVPIWENGGCMGNHSIYVTVLEGLPPGRPMDGVVIGDTFGNIEVASGDKGPGTAEVTLWMNSMSLYAKRHIDGTEYTSEESFSFTAHDELIPAEVLAANGYCDGSIEKCREAQNLNQVCRGHYSWRVTFHKLNP
jgi:uncharacterized protein YraI